MTGPQDSQDTRPISVAELLARNGTIGAPPVGGRRRRRRGNNEAVTVAELTGEIPIVTDHAAETGVDAAEPEAAEAHEVTDAHEDTEAPETADAAPAEGDLLEHPDADLAEVPAEEMEPDPVDLDDEDAATAVGEDEPEQDQDELPAYLRATPERLFGGRATHDQLRYSDDAEAGTALPVVPPRTTTADDHEHEEAGEPPTRMQRIGRGAMVVLQSILAVAFGAGLFIAFDELWKWNNIVALVLSVLVILGLVAAVWVVRKTEDIASTLIAVAVGALVTMGPLVLHSQ